MWLEQCVGAEITKKGVTLSTLAFTLSELGSPGGVLSTRAFY